MREDPINFHLSRGRGKSQGIIYTQKNLSQKLTPPGCSTVNLVVSPGLEGLPKVTLLNPRFPSCQAVNFDWKRRICLESCFTTFLGTDRRKLQDLGEHPSFPSGSCSWKFFQRKKWCNMCVGVCVCVCQHVYLCLVDVNMSTISPMYQSCCQYNISFVAVGWGDSKLKLTRWIQYEAATLTEHTQIWSYLLGVTFSNTLFSYPVSIVFY